jgi:hypothetical protein
MLSHYKFKYRKPQPAAQTFTYIVFIPTSVKCKNEEQIWEILQAYYSIEHIQYYLREKYTEKFSGGLQPLPRFRYYLEGNNIRSFPKVNFRVGFILLTLFKVCSTFALLDVNYKNIIDISKAAFDMLFYFTIEKQLNDSFQCSISHSTS